MIHENQRFQHDWTVSLVKVFSCLSMGVTCLTNQTPKIICIHFDNLYWSIVFIIIKVCRQHGFLWPPPLSLFRHPSLSVIALGKSASSVRRVLISVSFFWSTKIQEFMYRGSKEKVAYELMLNYSVMSWMLNYPLMSGIVRKMKDKMAVKRLVRQVLFSGFVENNSQHPLVISI